MSSSPVSRAGARRGRTFRPLAPTQLAGSAVGWQLLPVMLPLRRAGGLWARRRQCPVLMVPQRQMNLMPALREVVKLEQVCCPCFFGAPEPLPVPA